MYRTLLVPLDGSAFSVRALPTATTLARHLGVKLILMRAVLAPVAPGEDPVAARIQAVDEVQTYLSGLAASYAEQGLNVEISLPYGDAAELILEGISLHAADLVVMCTHGRSGLGRWLYGSVAEKVLAQSPTPVLLIRPTGEASRFELQPEQASLLVPLDGSAFAETALPHAAALARAFGGTILLLRVVEPPLAAYEGSYREAASYLEEVAQRLRATGLSVQTYVRRGAPADIIAYWGEETKADLIVMATRGRTGIARVLLGSVALEVVRRSPWPIMLVRPAE